jgi:hypothetical protein
MIYTNPDADIFILPGNRIQVRKLDFEKSSVEILEIGGEDAEDLIRRGLSIFLEGNIPKIKSMKQLKLSKRQRFFLERK